LLGAIPCPWLTSALAVSVSRLYPAKLAALIHVHKRRERRRNRQESAVLLLKNNRAAWGGCNEGVSMVPVGNNGGMDAGFAGVGGSASATQYCSRPAPRTRATTCRSARAKPSFRSGQGPGSS